jgi:hypothetical protein
MQVRPIGQKTQPKEAGYEYKHSPHLELGPVAEEEDHVAGRAERAVLVSFCVIVWIELQHYVRKKKKKRCRHEAVHTYTHKSKEKNAPENVSHARDVRVDDLGQVLAPDAGGDGNPAGGDLVLDLLFVGVVVLNGAAGQLLWCLLPRKKELTAHASHFD